jgi:hypothetical protein
MANASTQDAGAAARAAAAAAAGAGFSNTIGSTSQGVTGATATTGQKALFGS